MPTTPRIALAFAFIFACAPASAVESTLTQGGFTGLAITPNARLLGWGHMGLAYDNQLPGAANHTGHNLVLGMGLLPNLEVVGRLAANSPVQANCFMDRCNGIRDLSASAKVGIGLDAHNRFRVAFGAADIGGAATNFRTYYGVLTYASDAVEISGGLARQGSAEGRRSRSPLHGPFAAAAWQPLPWLRGQLEYSDRNAWAGVRLFAPEDWLPQGWSAYVGANARLTDTTTTARSWFSAGISIPLYKVPELPTSSRKAPLPPLAGTQQRLPAYEARNLAPETAPALAPAPSPAPAPAPALAPAVPERPAQGVAGGPVPGDPLLHELAQGLRAKGLEDISIGRMPDATIAVRVNNASYQWNTVDALGAALGAISRTLGGTSTGYRLILMQRQVPLVAVTGQADCLRDWIQAAQPRCTAGELSTPGAMALEPLHAGAAWVVRDLQPSWKTVRLAVAPVLRTHIGTEVGAFDHSTGVRLDISQPLWQGASLDWGITHELGRTSDYGPTGVFGAQRVRNGTDRLALTQTVRLPLERWLAPGDDLMARRWGLAGVTAQATLGRIGHHFDGGIGSVRWEPGDGRHRVTVQGGIFRNSEFGLVPGEPRTAYPALASYRYSVTATRTDLEATGGQFMNNDRGLQLGLRQWFGDVAVQVYLRRTQFSASDARTFAGIQLSVPIGPRRDMDPRGLQLTGTPRFAHAIESVVGERQNVVASGYGVVPPAPSLALLHNSDRTSLLYFEDNMRRLRDAAR